MWKRSGRPFTKWKRRAILIESSIASVPELVKKTVSAKLLPTNLPASDSWPGTR